LSRLFTLASFSEAAGAEAKIGSGFKSNTIYKFTNLACQIP
jgi:hypothetical protein